MSLAQLPAPHCLSVFTFVLFVDSSQLFAPICSRLTATTGSQRSSCGHTGTEKLTAVSFTGTWASSDTKGNTGMKNEPTFNENKLSWRVKMGQHCCFPAIRMLVRFARQEPFCAQSLCSPCFFVGSLQIPHSFHSPKTSQANREL